VATEQNLIPVKGAGWLSGFMNMLRKENGRWVSTHQWLVQSVIWLMAVNGMVTLVLYLSSAQVGAESPMETLSAVQLFFTMLGSITPFGVVILTQSDVVGEKQSGTAEWVLSSPLSRESFLLSKLVTNSAWVFAIMVFMQGVAFNLILVAFGLPTVPALNMVAGLAVNCLHLLFWLTLALMLGASFKGRGPVLGISMAFLLLQDLVAQLASIYVPWLIPLLPKSLLVQGLLLAQGDGLTSIVSVVAVALWSMMFTAVAVWRFRQEEF
jgi:ABC-2 type transport system permease protein